MSIHRRAVLPSHSLAAAAVCVGFILALNVVARTACAGQLIKVHGAAGPLTTTVAAKEQVTWWNHDKDRPVSVTFVGPVTSSNFSTHGSRFLFTDEKTLTSNLIPPGAVASVAFEASGEYRYVITGLPEDIHGTIIVR
ncbi:MAG TPA: hypothetical protein P5287_02550 [bacterium]|nr:hypothetical protein [bacterium]